MVYIERPLITQIDTKDPAVLYSTDLKATLKNILNDMYIGKCFKRCHITEILEIDENSPPIMEAMRNGGSARISVKFRVRGIVYDMYEVIPDAKIVEIIEDGKMLLRSRHAAIMLAADARLQHFRVGMTVPVRVMEARYIPYRDTISVTGIPFIPLQNTTDPFDVNFTADDQTACEPLIARLREAQKRFEALPHAREWRTFLDGKSPTPADFKQVDFTAVMGRGRITRPDWTPLMDTTVAWQVAKDEKTIKNSATVLKGYIQQSIKQLDLACVLAEQYTWTAEKSAPWVAIYLAGK